jgi:hypothetical protein
MGPSDAQSVSCRVGWLHRGRVSPAIALLVWAIHRGRFLFCSAQVAAEERPAHAGCQARPGTPMEAAGQLRRLPAVASSSRLSTLKQLSRLFRDPPAPPKPRCSTFRIWISLGTRLSGNSASSWFFFMVFFFFSHPDRSFAVCSVRDEGLEFAHDELTGTPPNRVVCAYITQCLFLTIDTNTHTSQKVRPCPPSHLGAKSNGLSSPQSLLHSVAYTTPSSTGQGSGTA